MPRVHVAFAAWLTLGIVIHSIASGEDFELPPSPVDIPPPFAFQDNGLSGGFSPAPAPTSDGDLVTSDAQRLVERLEALEQREKKRLDDEREKKAAGAKLPTVKWSGQLQVDSIFVNQDQASKETFGNIENGEAFRRARLAAFGDYGLTDYRIEMDFAQAGRPTFLDVYVGMHDLPYIGRVRAGHFFEPFSLERMTSNRFTTFLERSVLDQAFAPARNTGFAMGNNWADGNGTWAAGFFRSDSDNFGDDVGDNFESSFTTRATWLPWFDDDTGSDYLHVGAGYSFRGANNETVRFRVQPETRIGAAIPNIPFFVDTGNIPADTFQLFGVEAVWVHERVSFQSEYVVAPVNTKTQGTLTFNAWYFYASYFLTDDFRPYRKDAGTMDRVQPKRPFLQYHGDPKDKTLELGPGAWEFAMRVSQVDLNDGGVQGGRLTDMTLAVNWYLNQYTRISTNWVRAFLRNPKHGPSATDFFGVRVGFEF
jgi:phosphate-selective porin OprO/OprP